MRTFIVYRPAAPAQHYEMQAANPPDAPQYEGVIFSDGTVVIRWLTPNRSHSIWSGLEPLIAVHGHPEYQTRIEWFDGAPEPMPGFRVEGAWWVPANPVRAAECPCTFEEAGACICPVNCASHGPKSKEEA